MSIFLIALAVLSRDSSAFDVVLEARTYANGGGYHWEKGNSGVPEEIRWRDQVVLEKGKGSFCSGFTLAVAMKVIQKRKLAEGKTLAEVKAFQKTWYGSTADSAERQCALAVVQLGVGQEVTTDEARAGDFVQFWRQGEKRSGHSAVFLAWVVIDDRKVGFCYRSSQQSTSGVGDKLEFFADVKELSGKVDRARIYFARLRDG